MLFVSTNIVMYTKTIKTFDLASEFEKNFRFKKMKIAERGFLPYFLKWSLLQKPL
jgi:hypothetical protein